MSQRYESRLYTESDGMVSSQVLEIEVDSKNNLWITNAIGLSYFDRLAGTFETYTDRDGLIRENLDKNSMHSLVVLRDDKVFLGEFNRFSIIDRSQKPNRNDRHNVLFTGISVFGEPKVTAGAVRQDGFGNFPAFG